MKRSWIKLYVEILDDEKLCELPPRLKWRFIELLLVAAEKDCNGMLPNLKRLTWRLRADEKELAADLRELQKTGTIRPQADAWMVVNFSKRQAKMTTAERVSAYRKRKVTDDETKSYTRGVTDSSSTSSSSSSLGRGKGEGAHYRPASEQRVEAFVKGG